MDKTTYREKLSDPRWQKLRLEIFQRDNFSCCICEATDKTLHVHHKYYLKKTEPWDHPPACLSTLCEDCHQLDHELKSMQEELIITLLSCGFHNIDFEQIIDPLQNIITRMSPERFKDLLLALDQSDFNTERVDEIISNITFRPIKWQE